MLIPRIGYGFDTHRFDLEAKAQYLMLGGIKVPFSKKFVAHSDGDVVLHAVTDALLGAIGEEDIGMHFPPSDKQWEGRDSSFFLEFAHKLMIEKNGQISNIDITIIAESPKLMTFKSEMQKYIAKILYLCDNQVSVKAKTSEKLGFIGRGEGISTSAVCLVLMPQPKEVSS